jgi:outer membrane receptor protein involved in Fe transport
MTFSLTSAPCVLGRPLALLLAGTIAGVGSGEALAGQAGQVGGIDDIVVTATRRAESIQTAPASVSALSGAQIDRAGSFGFEDVIRRVPGLIVNDAGVGSTQLIIRGIATENRNFNLQPTVGIYLDELSANDPIFPFGLNDVDLFDMERVEVLRGPQGTLFGSGSIGGAIRLITTKPDLGAFEANARGMVETTKSGGTGYGVSAMVNVPIVDDKVGARAVVSYRHRAGVIDRVLLGGENTDTSDFVNARLAVAFAPTDDLKVTASLFYNKQDPQDSEFYRERGPQTVSTPGIIVPNEPFTSSNLTPEFVRTERLTPNLTIDWDLGFAQFLSSTTYEDYSMVSTTDNSLPRSPLSTLYTGTLFPISQVFETDTRRIAQEFRLTSSSSGPFQWLVGFLYHDIDRDVVFTERVPGLRPNLAFQGNTDLSTITVREIDSREVAVYGELSYNITEKLRVAVSARAFENTLSQIYPTGVGWFLGQLNTEPVETSESKITPRFVASYQFNSDHMLYASAAEGYRVGGVNPAVTGVGQPPAYQPDSVWAYEVGLKNSFLDRRLIVNVAAFYNAWTDIQFVAVKPFQGVTVAYVENGGKAHTLGMELEMQGRPTPNLDFSIAVTLLDARMDQDNLAVEIARGGVRAGDQLPGSPPITTSENIRYTWRDLPGEASAFVDLSHQYVGKAYNGFNRNNAAVRPYGDWHRVDFLIGYERPSWSVSAYVNNLLDSDTVTNLIPTNPVRVTRQRPRTIGLAASYRF